MSNLDEQVKERIRFLKEQINRNDKPFVSETFRIQIDVLSNSDRENVELLIQQKRKHLATARTIQEYDTLFTELDALEWLQRQVVRHIA